MSLRKEARGRHCQIRIPGVCNHDHETTVLCHLRLAGITGVAKKSADLLGAWGCSACHEETERKKSSDSIQRAFLEGMARTQYQLIKEGKVTW